jgi:hypothetical protein
MGVPGTAMAGDSMTTGPVTGAVVAGMAGVCIAPWVGARPAGVGAVPGRYRPTQEDQYGE